ncbi:MAG: hypothetical protein M3290_05935 [Actinomycetota bacterium]|nr:hypothetical protein [Actinomycetota bacterium]
MRQRAVQWAAIAVVVVLGLAYGTPAMAHQGRGHAYGRTKQHSDRSNSSSESGTRYTEDNDTNDGGTPNNVPDSGDNMHPSGKDRSVENGNSGNQGNSASDPDDDGHGPDRSNGGPDKPNGSGGVDKADQDGNNGCGNDDDFEDDNEGWCGHHPKPEHAVTAEEVKAGLRASLGTAQPTTSSLGRTSSPADSPAVLGVRFVRGTAPAAVSALATGRLGAPGSVGAPLAFTGWDAVLYLVTALVLLVLGAAIVAGARKRT